MVDALIFDFDGLILDTEGPDYETWREVFEQYGCSLPFEDWSRNIGTATPVFDVFGYLESQVGRTFDRESLHRQRRRRYLEIVAQQPLLPGVREYLDDAHRLGLRLAVASSSTRNWVEGHLNRLGIRSYFETIKCRDDVAQAKPHPDLYLAALETLNVEPSAAIAIEDSPNGILAAKRAGLFCVAVPNALTRRLTLDHADTILESLATTRLEELLRRFQR